ncbi:MULTISPECIES: guanylate kinase [Lacrimispora]|uniref:Guanylate kinase n=2 Tax=Clostridia TaxID=186801 RepID=A0ABY7AEI2_9FIRM|nr:MULTISPECIES: guanylate kinase [Lacrimispora]MBS5959042.1 guanylate kinase [Clostridiales bacterium]WAJ23937.1 guanylate kinase [Lacrimispora xylanolytica]
MGKIFYVMGKSASGKDTIYKRLLEMQPHLKQVVLYTTRPIRQGEKDGKEYYFTSEDRLKQLREEGKIIEERTYQSILGPWTYFTVDDGQIDVNSDDSYLMIGTLESYEKTRNYYGAGIMVPIYIEVEDGKRLLRALEREDKQKEPKYAELCRRYLADEEDFKEDNLARCGIERRFLNDDLEMCLRDILDVVRE